MYRALGESYAIEEYHGPAPSVEPTFAPAPWAAPPPPAGPPSPAGGDPGPGRARCSVQLEYCSDHYEPCMEETIREGSCDGMLIERLSDCPDHRTHNRDECTAADARPVGSGFSGSGLSIPATIFGYPGWLVLLGGGALLYFALRR